MQRTALNVRLKVSSPQPQRPRPGIDLTKSILLPLGWSALAQDLSVLNELAYAGRSIVVYRVKLLHDEVVTLCTADVFEQR